ncbi:MAG TPA: DUF1203 domain-containing protein [Polyangiaceae bacterium]
MKPTRALLEPTQLAQDPTRGRLESIWARLQSTLLLPFEHHAVDSPYRASGAIYVRRGATETYVADNAIPQQLRLRLLSVRAYDVRGMMRAADICEGHTLEPVIEQCFADPGVAYLHVHNAKPGCFACKVERAPDGKLDGDIPEPGPAKARRPVG